MYSSRTTGSGEPALQGGFSAARRLLFRLFMKLLHATIMTALVSAAGSACVTTDTLPLGASVGALPRGCDVEVLGRAPAGSTDVASVEAVCGAFVDRASCMESLEKRACAAGGDVLYGVQESLSGKDSGTRTMIGTVAMRAPERVSRPIERKGAVPATSHDEDSSAKPMRPVFYPADT
jgi:hypothetical protein